MKIEDTARAAQLVTALAEIPIIRKRMLYKPTDDDLFDTIWLELSAAEMSGAVGQGSESYLYVPPELAPAIIDMAEAAIKAELRRIGVNA